MKFKSGIFQGDCVQKLAEVEPASVHLAFADPPFNIGYKYDVYDDRKGYEQYLEWSRQWMRGVARALRPDGTFWLAIGDEYAAELKLIAQNDLGLTCRSWVIWYYTFGVNCTKKFNRSHAHLFHFVKDGRLGKFTFNAQDPAVRVPSARQLVYADGRANPDGRLPDDTWILRPQDVPNGFSAEQDTWYYPRVAGTFKERAGFHGCQMPEQLLGRIIRISSDAGDRVLDPFGGSGTTLVVAKKLNRQFVGFELSEDYAKKIQARLDAVQPGQDLDGSAEPLRSAPTTPRARAMDLKTGIVEAFMSARSGYAVDHVLANPELNEAFVSACQRLSLPGQPVDWNRFLLRLRKAKGLPEFEVVRKRLFNYSEMDAFGFASEIALQKITTQTGMSLDEVLCDPGLASQFDEIAASFRPGFSKFDYRWAALTIRKRASQWRDSVESEESEYKASRLVSHAVFDDVLKGTAFEKPGVYVLTNEEQISVYVGKSLNVAQHMRVLSELQDTPAWASCRLTGVETSTIPSRLGNLVGLAARERLHSTWIAPFHADLIGKRDPKLNYEKIAYRP